MPGPDFELPYTSYTPGFVNAGVGRVNMSATGSASGKGEYESSFAYRTSVDPNMKNDVLRGNWEQTPLSIAFFSEKNVRIIQDNIKSVIYSRSSNKWKIDDQSVDELQIIMRAMFLQYARNQPTNIDDQVNELNSIVVEWAVPKIMSEIEQHFYYLRDISQMPQQIMHPVNVSSAGTKSFDLTRFF
jgi:hypothetical protein